MMNLKDQDLKMNRTQRRLWQVEITIQIKIILKLIKKE